MTIAHSGDPDDLVADFQPRMVHGELADGVPVSIVDAQGGSKRYSLFDSPLDAGQEFRARHVVMGELVAAEQPFCAVRFQVLGPTWLGPDEDAAFTANGGHLLFYPSDRDSRWFEFVGPNPLPLSVMDTGVINAVTTLTQLVTHRDAVDSTLEVRIGPESQWLSVYRGHDEVTRGGHPLINTSYLTAQRLARWIDFREQADGLDAAALDELQGVAIQTQLLALVAVAEGLHRRLFGTDKKRVPGLSNSKIEKMRRVARESALPLMTDPQFSDDDRAEFGNAISESFAHINEQTFRSRMEDLLADSRKSIPELGAAFSDWPNAVSMARNILAHQPALPDDVESGQFLDLLIALNYSMSWVLRTNLLHKAGFDPLTLQQAYRDSSAYGHHLANTRTLLANSRYAAPTQTPHSSIVE